MPLFRKQIAASGTAVVDFGAFPGKSMAQVDITGQASILSTSLCEARMRSQAATAEHSVDEHIAAPIRFTCGKIVDGVGFTIFAETAFGFEYGTFNVNWDWT